MPLHRIKQVLDPVSLAFRDELIVDHLLSRSIAFLHESGNDSAGGVVLVERVAQLLTHLLVLLLHRESLKHDRIPLVLQN